MFPTPSPNTPTTAIPPRFHGNAGSPACLSVVENTQMKQWRRGGEGRGQLRRHPVCAFPFCGFATQSKVWCMRSTGSGLILRANKQTFPHQRGTRSGPFDWSIVSRRCENVLHRLFCQERISTPGCELAAESAPLFSHLITFLIVIHSFH